MAFLCALTLKKGKLNDVKRLLFETASNDSVFASNRGYERGVDLSRFFLDGEATSSDRKAVEAYELPQAALLDKGVVFSFQPYEIGAFCEGCYHFIIPYERIKPCLTTHAVKILGI